MKQTIAAMVVVFLGVMIVPVGAEVITRTITPGNVQLPELAGDTFSFDFVINDPLFLNASGFQSVISLSGPGTLTFDAFLSEAVADDTDYWLYGNSSGVLTKLDAGEIRFKDIADDPPTELLLNEEIVARYAFTWDGIEGNYTIAIDLDHLKSFVLNDMFLPEPIDFDPGAYTGGSDGYHFGWRNGFFCLATLRPDGFAGYRQIESNKPAKIKTIPIVHGNRPLRLSANIGQKGYVKVRLFDKRNKLLAESEPLNGNFSDKKVTWRDGFSFDKLAKKPAQIQFEFQDATIYSFSFVE
jgi:hypothetical protein